MMQALLRDDRTDDRDWQESAGDDGGLFGKGARIQQSAVTTAGTIMIVDAAEWL